MSDTVTRLREAAEDLLLSKGQAATTLRDITERAGANVASVSYHFGSKDTLLGEVFRTVLEEATDIQRRRLEELPEDAPLEELVRVWLAPALPALDRDPREARLWSIIQRGMTERAPGLMTHALAIRPMVEQHLIERLARCLPHLDRDELLVRHAATLAAVAALGVVGAPSGPGVEMMLPPPDTRFADRLVSWIVGGLRAPATP